MKTYIALYAEDVRHYSTVEIEAVDTVDGSSPSLPISSAVLCS